MKIKFLGTSAGWPLPRLGCNCQICISKDPKDTRTRTQILINDYLLLDAGYDTYLHLKNNIRANKLKAVAISHEHPDHTAGLWDLSKIYNREEKLKLIIAANTYRKIRKIYLITAFEALAEMETDSFKTLGNPVMIEGLKVQLLPVNHTNSSYGILVTEDKKSLFYAPDFLSLPKETTAKVKGIDLILMDGSDKKSTLNHQSIDQGIILGKKLAAKNIYFVHIGHNTFPHKEFESYVLKKGGNNFYVPFDGLEITLS